MAMSERDLSNHIEHAPNGLVDPVKGLIKVAMRRVADGNLTSDNYSQFIDLVQGNRAYRITNKWVEIKKGKIISKYSKRKLNGLSIEGYVRNDDQVERLMKLDLPRNFWLLNADQIQNIRSVNPYAIRFLSDDLRNANVSNNSFNLLEAAYSEQEQARTANNVDPDIITGNETAGEEVRVNHL